VSLSLADTVGLGECGTLPDNEDAFYCAGHAQFLDDAGTREALSEVFVSERSAIGVPTPGPEQHLFRFGLERCLLTRTTGHGDPKPRHTVWVSRPS
jgi:hypothetical protein